MHPCVMSAMDTGLTVANVPYGALVPGRLSNWSLPNKTSPWTCDPSDAYWTWVPDSSPACCVSDKVAIVNMAVVWIGLRFPWRASVLPDGRGVARSARRARRCGLRVSRS